MSDTCLNCGGLIMEPNKTYGYAGKVCYCPVNPAQQWQRPAHRETGFTIPHPPKEPQPSQGAGAEEEAEKFADLVAEKNCGSDPEGERWNYRMGVRFGYINGHAAGRASQDARIAELEAEKAEHWRECVAGTAQLIARAEAAEKVLEKYRSQTAESINVMEKAIVERDSLKARLTSLEAAEKESAHRLLLMSEYREKLEGAEKERDDLHSKWNTSAADVDRLKHEVTVISRDNNSLLASLEVAEKRIKHCEAALELALGKEK